MASWHAGRSPADLSEPASPTQSLNHRDDGVTRPNCGTIVANAARSLGRHRGPDVGGDRAQRAVSIGEGIGVAPWMA
jgi:hypothetical protein